MTGVDLTRIDGVDGHTALKVVSEIGLDITRWPTAASSVVTGACSADGG